MSDRASPLHPAPPRDTALPFLYTAPGALVVAGGLLLLWGDGALATPWSPQTLALTHVVTLGFLTMLGVGLFAPLLTAAGGAPMPRPMAVHAVYYALVVGAGGLVWGTARGEAGPVFLAIGAVGVMGVVFCVHGLAGLRAARRGGSAIGALRVTLWSFFLAASLGLWLAHGHGGMLFPGPRDLWMGVHLSVALLGWIGGTFVAASLVVWPGRFGATPIDERWGTALVWAIGFGVTAPVAVLLAQYFGALPADAPWLRALAGWVASPAVVAVWFVHPALALRSLAGVEDDPVVRFVRVGLLVAPVAGVAGAVAAIGPWRAMAIAFGWIALVGWAVGGAHALLVDTLPRGLAPAPSSAVAPRAAPLLRVAWPIHVAALVLGVLAIGAPGGLPFARAAGALVVLDGALLLLAVASQRTPKGADPGARPAPG